MLTWVLFLGSKITVNELCRNWVMFLCLVPLCAVQTCLVLQGRAGYPRSHSAALPVSTWLSCSARCCTCSTSCLPQCLTLHFIMTSLWWVFHQLFAPLSELWMLFKYCVNILCTRDKFLKQLVKVIIQVVCPSSLPYCTAWDGSDFNIFHNF